MQKEHLVTDYEPVTRTTPRAPAADAALRPESAPAADDAEESAHLQAAATQTGNDAKHKPLAPARLRRGHALTYAGLFLFTFVLYFRPYELFPALAALSNGLAFAIGLCTLVAFLPSQLSTEGNLTARPREVNLVLLFVLTALLSLPLALDRGEAWETFSGMFIKAVLIFVVMINAVRTERRLKGLLLLAIAVSVFLSVGAIDDFRSGNLLMKGDRVAGVIGGLFGNPNDLALHLVTILPLAVTLMLRTRNLLAKLTYAASAALMVGGIVVSFSRGGFLGLLGVGAVLAWKLGRRNRLAVAVVTLVAAIALVAFMPSDYSSRLGSIVNAGADATGSSSQRQQLLIRSILVSLRHPLLGIGMGNFHILSIHELPSHNAYTQVSAELGATALALYVMFIVHPLRRLRQLERETFAARRGSHFYYLAVGVQASLVGYMIASFFGSVAYHYYVYYLVGYAVCLRRIYQDALAQKASAPARAEQTAEALPAYQESHA